MHLSDWTPSGMSLTGAPLTGIGVATLAEPDMLVVVEATAIVDHG